MGIKDILLCTETGKSLFVDEDLERVETCYEHINSEVEFVAIKKQRVFEVFLDNNTVKIVQITEIVD